MLHGELLSRDQKTDEFLATARKRFAAAAEDEKDLRAKFISDLKFASPDGDDQWDPQVKMQREQAGRPAMAFPRCHTFVQQVANQARDQKPQIKYAPRRDMDKDTAEVYEGMARYIQYSSDAQVAYDTAIEYSAGGSFGYYRFLTDYVDDEGDDQELKILPVLDPLTVYGILVPACFRRKPMFAFVVEDVPKDEFKAKYPDAEMTSMAWDDAERRGEGWVGSDSVRVAEYWYVVEKKGETGRSKVEVKFCKTNGFEILPDTETVWPGSSIPIVPVLGKQMIMEGKPRLFSVVRPQKSAQQMLNYAKSRIAETLSTSPISPFMVVEGQIKGYEKEWATLNTSPRPFLTYKVVDVAGRQIGPPQRQTFESPIQSLSSFVAQEVDDMKATTGIFDASLGQNGNETSGQAIARRQQQGNLTTMHFMDNLERSFRQGGDIMTEVIPKIYDTAREVEILGSDEAPKTVMINQEHDEAGKRKHYRIAGAKIKLIVTAGKAYGSKRSEAFDTVSQVVQTSPNSFPMVADVLFRNSDMAGADELAERFHKLLPPQLQNDQNNPMPPQAQAAVQQAQQQVQGMQAELAKFAMERQGKVLEHQGKMQQISAQSQADMALEDKKRETAVAVAEISTNAQILSEREAALRDLEAQLHDQAHEIAIQKDQQQHNAQQAQQMAAQQAASPQTAGETGGGASSAPGQVQENLVGVVS